MIFDCDGVLVDSEVISNRVLAAMLTEQGLPTTLPQARREYQGLLLADVLARAEAKLGRSLPVDWLARYETERSEVFRRELQPVTGAAETIERLRGAGLRVCVASQGKLEKTRLSLALTGLDHLLPEHVRFSAYSVANGKPAPDLFLHAAATIGVEPAACAVVEDTPSGVQAAVAAGMRAIGYTADSDESALREAGAEPLGSLDELPRLLGLKAAPIVTSLAKHAPTAECENRRISCRSMPELGDRIYERARLTGEFRLRSGATNSEYFDKYLFESDPRLLREIAEELVGLLPAGVEVLAGLELGGVPLAVAASQVSGLPTVFVRKAPKTYGTCRPAEGGEVAGRRIAVIEDVVTSGGQVIESCRQLRDRGAGITAVLCVIDREAGGRENLAREGLDLRTLFTMSQLRESRVTDPARP